MSFADLGLSPELLRAVSDEGYTEPTPVQRESIPLVLAGRDLLAGAQTGTGKTAAFVLPIIQTLHATRDRVTPDAPRPVTRLTPPAARPPIRVLIIAPTRELALQIEESVRTYGRHRPVRSTTIYGGVGFEPQVAKLRGGPEIVVATPGRLLDHVTQRTIDLSRVEVLVLDEADRLLDMGFIRDIRRIIALLPPRRQNLLFSATFSDEVRELSNFVLRDAASVQVTPRNTTAELVDQVVMPVDRERKRELLSHLVGSGRIEQALVFTRTKHGANRLAEQLVRDGINASAIHGNKSQAQRVRALGDFKAGRTAILVATDIAARGLDIEQLPHVVNFEMPMVAEDYVHRIGRTGRAGIDGQAISLVCVDEAPLLRAVQSLLRRPIRSETIEGFEPDRNARPEPIRLRSTPAERAALMAARGGTPARGATPTRNAGPSRSAAQSRNAGPSRPAAPSRSGRPSRGAPASHGVGIGNGPMAATPNRGGAPVGRGGHGGPSRGARRGGFGMAAQGHSTPLGRVVPGGTGRSGDGAGTPSSANSGAIGSQRSMPGERLRRLDPRS